MNLSRTLTILFMLLPTVTSSAQKPAFEAVAVKRSGIFASDETIRESGDRFLPTNLSLMQMILFAFAPREGPFLPRQIFGGPEWIGTDHFDIEAKVKGNVESVPTEQLRLMLQTLLEDRFRLKVHRETRELPVYNVIVAGGGPKRSANQTPPDPRNNSFRIDSEDDPSLPRGALHMRRTPTGTILSGTSVAMPLLKDLLQWQEHDRIVIDKTNFKGLMDIQLTFTEYPESNLFTAIQDLGLKAEPVNAPVEVLVIDRAQKPTEN